MKKYFVILYVLTFFLHVKGQAQNSVGIGGTPDASAQLDIKSNSSGLLMPRLTTAQRLALSATTNGLTVFDTDTKTYWFAKNGSWKEVHLSLPVSATLNSTTPLLAITNTSSASETALQLTAAEGTVVKGSAAATYSGVFGQNNENGKGVTGHNTANGTGVYARGLNGTALFADILNGTGDAGYLKQTNTTGKALVVEGNVRIFGSSVPPGIGKNFQCTNNGAGFWIMNPSGRIHAGFVSDGFQSSPALISNGVWTRYTAGAAEYNFTNSYTPATGVFKCPVNGFYKFNARMSFSYFYHVVQLVEYVRASGLRLMLKRNGTTSVIVTNIKDYYPDRVLREDALNIENHVHLLVGDEVWVECYQERQYAAGAGSPGSVQIYDGLFSGNIVWADE